MRFVFQTGTHSATVALCALVALAALNSCGGDGSPAPPATNTAMPTPTVTPTPGQFTGNFTGTVTLDAGRIGTVSFTVKSDETAAGTLVISGGTMPETVPLTGFVALSNGDFSLSGSSSDGSVSATVSGTLPASSAAPGILVIQIGTSFFRGTIGAA